MNESKLWTKDFFIDTIANFILFFVHYMPLVTIAVYAADHYKSSPGQAGLVAGIYIIGAILGRTITGYFIDRAGRKKTLYVGLCFFLITTLLYFAAANSLLLLLIVRFLHGVGFGISSTATAAIVANIIPEERIGEGIGYYSLSVTIASAIGPFVGMLLIKETSFNMILALSTILIVICLVILIFLKVPEAVFTQEQFESMKGWSLKNFFEASAMPIAFVAIFIGLSIGPVIQFLSSYVRIINLVDAGSIFFLVYALAMLISRPISGRWFDKKGENFVIYPSFFILALGLITLSLTHQSFVLLFSAFLIGIGYGTFLSSGQALTIKLCSKQRIGLATSTYLCLLDFGVGSGTILLGLLIPITGFRGIYLFVAVVVLFCIVLYYFLHGRKKSMLNGAACR